MRGNRCWLCTGRDTARRIDCLWVILQHCQYNDNVAITTQKIFIPCFTWWLLSW